MENKKNQLEDYCITYKEFEETYLPSSVELGKGAFG